MTSEPPLARGGYAGAVVDHFQRPRNAGHLAAAPDVIEGSAGSPAQGVRFVFSARIAESRLAVVRFQAYGCPHCLAAASWLSERLPGAGVAALAAWRWREAAQALQVPASKHGRLLLLEDAVRALAAAWRAAPHQSQSGQPGPGLDQPE